jgi:hypothetical protein
MILKIKKIRFHLRKLIKKFVYLVDKYEPNHNIFLKIIHYIMMVSFELIESYVTI